MTNYLLKYLAVLRMEANREKYTLPSGENAGFHRDNCLDIMEEIADAWNIVTILEERIDHAPDSNWLACNQTIGALRSVLDTATQLTAQLRAEIPMSLAEDEEPVLRDVKWSKDGLQMLRITPDELE